MLTGVTTSFIENSTLFGRCKKDFAVLECDENSLPLISRYLDAEVLAVTNIFRDQLDRYGEVTHTLSVIKNGADNMPAACLVLNADCPLTNSLADSHRHIKYGLDADFGEIDISEARYCPRCENVLTYDKKVFSHLGTYRCNRCGYQRGNTDVAATDIKLFGENGSEFTLVTDGDSIPCRTSLGGVYNIYNYICAVSVLKAVDINDFSLLSDFDGAFGRMEVFKGGGKKVLLLLVKNPVGLSSCVSYASRIHGTDALVLALNDNAADGRDVSWIWDSDIEPLKSMGCGFYTFGTRAYDMTLRLKYSYIPVKQTLTGEDTASLFEVIDSGKNTVIMANYTAMMKIRKALRHRFGGKDFWE